MKRRCAFVAWSVCTAALMASMVAGWVRWRVDSPAAVAGTVESSLDRAAVRNRVATLLTVELARKAPKLADQQQLANIVLGVSESVAFREVIELAVDALYVEVARGRPAPALDRAEDVYAAAVELLRVQQPALAARLPPVEAADSFHFRSEGAVGSAIRGLHRVSGLVVPAIIAVVITGAVALRLTRPRRRWRALGTSVAMAGLVTAGVAAVATRLAVRTLPRADRNAGTAVASVVAGPLLRLALLTALAGVITIAVTLYGGRVGRRWRPVLVVVCGAGLATAGWGELRESVSARSSRARCLGHVELCARRFDQVALVGTHNSMNNAAAGFLVPEQRLDIEEQLENGVRALLVDTHAGRRAADGLVWTEVEVEGRDRDRLVTAYGATVVDEAAALRNRSAPPTGPHELYLCHNLCELGATAYADALATVRHWLLAHRGEIVMLFVQDESAPADNIDAIRRAGLEPLAFVHHDGDPWPTLKEMIRADRRLFVAAEHQGGGADFYHEGFPLYSDTSYDVTAATGFTCDVNRGRADSPLFLLNHWVETALPSPNDAAAVNDATFLLERVAACQRARARTPNIIAVNFSDLGDVNAVVDRLNGIGA